jgi:CubicO group peptidase (beta-lactamase class C family)
MSLADIGNLEKLTAALCAQPVAFTPGSRCHYNSFGGICLLGQILVLTDPKKRSFAKIAREDLFEPLGMTDMHFGNSENDPRRVPVSFGDRYTGPSNAGVVAVLTAPMNGELCEVPAGNAFGTTMDVYRFTQLIRGRGTANGHRLISPALFDYAAKNHTGTMLNDAWDFECVARQIPPMVANFSLLGGYARGEGHSITAMGYSASNRAVCAVGGGSTMWMFDPERDLSFVFLSAGLVEGLAHLERLSRLSDLALAACD